MHVKYYWQAAHTEFMLRSCLSIVPILASCSMIVAIMNDMGGEHN